MPIFLSRPSWHSKCCLIGMKGGMLAARMGESK